MLETERARERQKLGDPVAVRFGCDRDVVRMTLPPRTGFAHMRYQPSPPAPRHDRVEGRPVAGLRGHSQIVAPPQAANQSERFPGRRPLGDGDHIVDVRVAFEDALAAAEYEDLEPGLRKTSPDRAHERRGEQHVTEAP